MIILTFVAVVFLTAKANAQSLYHVSTQINDTTNPDYSITIQKPHNFQYAHIPVKINFKRKSLPATAIKKTHKFKIEFVTDDSILYSESTHVFLTREIELKPTENTSSLEIVLPMYEQDELSVVISENSSHVAFSQIWSRFNRYWQTYNVLVVNDKDDNTQVSNYEHLNTTSKAPSNEFSRMLLAASILNQAHLSYNAPEENYISNISISGLKQDWRQYHFLDFIVLSKATFEYVRMNRRVKYDALIDWVSVGGNLIIIDVDAPTQFQKHLANIINLDETTSRYKLELLGEQINSQSDSLQIEEAVQSPTLRTTLKEWIDFEVYSIENEMKRSHRGLTTVSTDNPFRPSSPIPIDYCFLRLQEFSTYNINLSNNYNYDMSARISDTINLDFVSHGISKEAFAKQLLYNEDYQIYHTNDGHVVEFDETPFHTARYQFGTVSCVKQFDKKMPTLAKLILVDELINSFNINERNYQLRNKLPDFFDFLIEGVGLPPIMAFLALIIVFCLLIGPVNYYILRSKGNLNWIIITSPILAFVFCLTMISYSFFSDGLTVQTRSRSVTHIDQTNNLASCWGHTSYFAPFGVSGGLNFTNDTIITPYRMSENSKNMSYGEKRVGTMFIEPIPKKNLVNYSGLVSSRTPVQVQSVRHRKTDVGLGISSNDQQEQPEIKLHNRLNTNIQYLVVVDENGEYYATENLADKAKVSLKGLGKDPLKLRLGEGILGKIKNKMLDEKPVPTIKVRTQRDTVRYGYHYDRTEEYMNANINKYSGSSFETFANATRGIQAATPHAPTLAPNTYLAIVDKSPEFQDGGKEFLEVQGLHIIFGHW